MKTAITVLQEMMIKLGVIPEYEYIAQSGPQHLASFEYRCAAQGEQVTAVARSKKEAKQEAARALLLKLAARGFDVPPPFNVDSQTTLGQYSMLKTSASEPKKRRVCATSNNEPSKMLQHRTEENKTMSKKEDQLSASTSGVSSGGVAKTAPTVDSRSYVALLRELCEEYRLPAVDYDLVGDTGPPHLRHFTVRARIGQHARTATATTKRAAKQAAAETLYLYLREHLRVTGDFVEEAALARAHERAMARYSEARAEVAARPRLEQRVAQYHAGLREAHDAEQVALAQAAVREAGAREVALQCAAAALQLTAEWASLARATGEPLHVLTLAPTAPPLAFAGDSRADAAAAALAYIREALPLDTAAPPPPPTPDDLLA